jgi:hypothetical protein
MQADEGGGKARSPDYNLWQICRETDAPDDEAALLLDLAAFAEGRLDDDDRERVLGLVSADPDAIADVAAARALADASFADAPAPAGLAELIARACAAHPSLTDAPGQVIPFPPVRRQAANWNGLARWGSLAAAVVVAGWLGFNLGLDTWSDYRQMGQGGDDAIHELLDPSAGFMRDLTDATRT